MYPNYIHNLLYRASFKNRDPNCEKFPGCATFQRYLQSKIATIISLLGVGLPPCILVISGPLSLPPQL